MGLRTLSDSLVLPTLRLWLRQVGRCVLATTRLLGHVESDDEARAAVAALPRPPSPTPALAQPLPAALLLLLLPLLPYLLRLQLPLLPQLLPYLLPLLLQLLLLLLFRGGCSYPAPFNPGAPASCALRRSPAPLAADAKGR